jgi:hypothetical protein
MKNDAKNTHAAASPIKVRAIKTGVRAGIIIVTHG